MKLAYITLSKLTLLVSFLLYSALSHAQLATYDFNGGDGRQATNPPASSGANVTASDMSKSSGLTYFNSTVYTDGFTAYDWPTGGSINTEDYYEFTIVPDGGYELTLTSIVLDELYADPTSNHTYNWTIRSSIDDFGSDIVTPFAVNATTSTDPGTTTGNNIDLTGGTFDNLTSPVTFRLYAYNQSANTQEWGIDNVVINGSVNAPNTIISTIDFESINYTLNSATSAGGPPATEFFDVYALADHSTDHVFAGGAPSGVQGANYLGYRNNSPTNNIGNNNFTNSTSIDVSSYENIDLHFSIANITLGDGYEDNDSITIRYQFDGGGYKLLTQWAGNSGVVYMTENTDGTGGGDGSNALGPLLQSFSRSIPKEGSLLDVQFSVITSVEDVVIDNIAVTGTSDVTAPEVTSIVRQSPSSASTTATSVTYRVTFDENVTNVNLADFTLSGTASGAIDNVTANSATEYDIDIITVSGNGDNLNLDFAGGQDITDLAGNAFAGVINAEEEYNVDNTAPEVTSIIRQTPATATTTATSVTFRVTFDEDVTNVNLADFTLSGSASGSLNTITPNSATEYDVEINTVSGDGDNLNLDFAGGQDITDIIGNAFGGVVNSEEEYMIDNTAPQVTSIVRQSPSGANTNATAVTFRVTFNEDVANVTLADFALSGTASGTLDNVTTNSASEYDVDVITVSGNGNLNLDFDGAQDITDIIGNAFAGTINSEQEYTIDNTAPEVSSIVRQTPSTANTTASSVTFRVTFDEDVSNVNLADFVLSGSAFGTVDNVTANSATEYDINVISVSGNGDNLNLDFAGGQDITDIAGNAFAGVINSEEEYNVDNTAPEVTSIIRQTPATATTTATSVTFRVTFDEDVTNVNLADFTLSGSASGSLNTITPNSATEYDVEINTVSGDGDNLNLDFAGGQDITDIIGNAFGGVVNSEEEYTIDNTAPQVTSIVRQSPSGANTNATAVTFRVTFNEDVANVTLADFALSGTASGTLDNVTTNSASEYDVDVITVSGDGDLNLDFDGAQDITDIIGNAFAGTINSEQEYTIDNTAPEVTSIVRQTPSNALTNANTVTFRVTFTEDVLNVNTADFILTGSASGAVNSVSPVSADIYDVEITTVSGDGNLNLDFAGGQNITDLATNTYGLSITSEQEYTIDNTTPIATFTTLEDGEQTSFVITFNEELSTSTTSITDINNLLLSAINDPTGDNEAIDVSSVAFSVSWNLTTPTAPVATITIPITTFVAAETVRVNFINNIVQDVAGNGISSATNIDGIITDVTPPALSPDIMSFADNGASPETIVFTMSEELDFIEGGTVTGFTYGAGIAITNAIYSDKGATNTITLTSSADGQWSTSTLISYTQASGDVLDLAGLELADIVNHPVELNLVNLTAGDIAFTGYNSDNPNDFSFVLLRDVDAGTEIKFTDQGWKAPGFGTDSDDGTSTWSTASFLFAGTEISVSGTTVTGGGSITAEVDLSTSGDQIIAYQGAIGNNLTFIAGIHMDDQHFDNTTKWTQLAQAGDQENRSVIPDGLTAGVETVTPENGGEQDNGVYDQSVVAGNRATVRAEINDFTNWNTSNNRLTISSGDNYDLSPDLLTVNPTNGGLTNANPGTIEITFDEDISAGLSTFTGDIRLNLDDGTPVLTYNIGDPQVTFGTNSIMIDISAAQPLSDGVIYEVDLAERIVVNDDGNANKSIAGDSDWKFTVDAIAPTISTINRDPAVTVNANNGTTQSSVSFIVTFSEVVIPGTVNSTDFTLSGGAAGGTATINTTVTGTGDTYTVTVDNVNLLGTLTIDFTGAIDDLVGNTGATGKAGDESFIIINPEPSEQPTAFSAVPGADNFTLNASWTAGGGAQLADGYLIYYQESPASFPADPTDLTAIPDGAGVVNSATNSVAVSGLNSGTQYDFKVYPYTNSGNQIDYKIDGTILTGSGTTGVGQQSLLFFGTDAASISSVSNTLGSSIVNFSFFVADDWANPGIDNADTRITQFSFHPKISGNDINWVDAIEGAQLSDGTNVWNTDVNGGDITIDNSQITFSNIPTGTGQLGEITDSNFKEYFLSIWIKSSILDAALRNDIDGKNFAFEIDQTGFTFDVNSSEVAAGQVVSSGDTRNVVTVVATDLDWETQPPALAGVLAPFTSAPVIEAVDANGNRDIDYVGPVTTITNAGGLGMNNNPDATGLNHSFATGIYTFDITAGTGFNYQSPGDGTLTITSTGLNASPASNLVTVSFSNGTSVVGGGDPEPATISSLYTDLITATDYRFDIDIQDDASGLDDNVPTRINQITFHAATLGGSEIETNWGDIIENASIWDGSNLHHIAAGPAFPGSIGGAINSSSLVFSSLPNTNSVDIGYIGDNNTKKYKLFIWFKTTINDPYDDLIDNMHFNFAIDGTDIIAEVNSSTADTSLPLVTSGSSNNRVEVIATEIAFEQQPPLEQLVNTDFGVASPIAEAADVNGNRDLDYVENVAVTDVAPTEIFINPPPTNFTSGALIFPSNFQYTQTGTTQLRITPTTPILIPGPLPAINSNVFTIRVGKGTTITAGAGTEPTEISSLNTSSTGTFVFDFEINDDAGTEDDGNPTLITGFSVTQGATFNDPDFADWTNIIEGAEISDGTNTLNSDSDPANVTITSTSIDFSGISTSIGTLGYIGDNATKTYTLNIWLKDSIDYRISGNLSAPPTLFADGKKLEFVIHEDNIQTSILGSAIQDNETAGSGDANAIDVDHTELQFYPIVGPSLNTPFSPIVYARDAEGNTDIDFNEAIDAYSNTSTTPGGALATSNNPNTAGDTFTAGVYTFPANFQFTESGEGVTIEIETSTYAGGSAGVSNVFDILSSFDSFITTVADGGNIPYINFPPVVLGNLDDVNSYTLAEFQLHDGNPVAYGNDVDGAPTTIDAITISISNPQNLEVVGLFDAGGTQYGSDMPAAASVTFTGVNFSANDDLTNNFFVKASFNNTDADITDNDIIDIAITNVVAAGGSQFEDNVYGGEPDGLGGFTQPATTPGNNYIEVVATAYSFTQSPNAIEGVNIPLVALPIIQAQDANAVVDADITETMSASTFQVTAPVGVSGTLSFTNGISDLSNLRYATTGDGTLTITDNGARGISTGVSNAVDIVNSSLSIQNIGVNQSAVLISGADNQIILGFNLDATSNSVDEPVFNNVTFDFNQNITPIYENFRLFKAVNIVPSPILGSDAVLVSGAVVSSITSSQVSFNGFTEILNPMPGSSDTYYLVADVSNNANENTPQTTAQISADNSFVSNGSMNGGPANGGSYTYNDPVPPAIVSLTPANRAENIPSNITHLLMEFSEPVIPQDSIFNIFLFSGDTQIGTLTQINRQAGDTDSTLFEIPIPGGLLNDDTQYYVTFADGDVIAETGFIDRNANPMDGITDKLGWSFTTADANAPIFQLTNSVDIIETIYDIGFDLKVQMDEEGKVYYLVLDDGDTPPTDGSEIFEPLTYSGGGTIRSSGSIDIGTGFQNFFISIRGLSSSQDYDVYLIGEDEVPNRMSDPGDTDPNVPLILDISTVGSSPALAGFLEDLEICPGDYQFISTPFRIIEGGDNDLSTGSDLKFDITLPTGFEFYTASDAEQTTMANYDPSGEIDNISYEYRNPSTLRIIYSTSGGSSRDEITISGLKIRTFESSSTGTIELAGNATNGNFQFGQSLGQAILDPIPAVDFTLNPSNTVVNINDADQVSLIPNTIADTFSGESNLFTGTAVNGTIFDVQLAGVGTHIITHTFIDDNGCRSSVPKTVDIIDLTIEGLKTSYCQDEASATIDDQVVINGEVFRLNTLTMNNNTNPGINSSLTFNGTNYIFDPAIAVYDGSGDSSHVVLEFTAIYDNLSDPGETEEIRQIVRAFVLPTVAIQLDIEGNLNDFTNYCDDFGDVSVSGFPAVVGAGSTGVFTITSPSLVNVMTGLTDFGDGNATFDTEVLASDYGPGEYTITYTFTNNETACVNTASTTFIINESPVVNITNVRGCEGQEVILENTSGNSIAARRWDFDDEGKVKETTNPLDSLATNIYSNPGAYNITLEVITDRGCRADNFSSPFVLNIGGIPQASFNFTGVNIEDQFIFTNNTPKPGILSSDTVRRLRWQFGDGNQQIVDRITNADDIINYTYSSTLIDTVSLTVESSIGCYDTLSLPIAVLDKYDVATAPSNGFETGSEGWIIIDPGNNSWMRSDQNDNIGEAGNFMWVTGPNTSYNGDEVSYIYSPSMDISAVARPLIQFDAFWDMATGDGAILQYSIDDKNVADPTKVWSPLGEIDSGEDWYNGDNLPSRPGKGATDYGWSDSLGMQQPKHVLDSIPTANRQNVNFRFAFSSINANPNRAGFAFDNLFFGTRTRTVMVENFTNTSQSGITRTESDYLKSFDVEDADGTVMIKINYHTDFPGFDPLNDANTVDPSARALYYDISQTPRAVIDGFIAQDEPFSQWGLREFNLRSLILAQFDLDVSVSTSGGALNIEAIPTPQNNSVLNENILITAAVLEKDILLSQLGVSSVNSNEIDFEFVLRKLLPNAAGLRLDTSGAQNQMAMDPVNFSWIPGNVIDLDDIAVVVFVQNEMTREIYQSEIILDVTAPDQVTGIDSEVAENFNLYPNPANSQVTIVLGSHTSDNVEIYDSFGKLVYSKTIDQNDRILNVNTQDLAAGLYHVQLRGKDNQPIRKRLIIMHRE